ncbi:MAG: heparinase II/III family protein [Verrucomicrobiota bacterium]
MKTLYQHSAKGNRRPIRLLSRCLGSLLVSAALLAPAAAPPDDTLPEKALRTLRATRGVHPRIFLTDAKIAALKRAIQGPQAGAWLAVQNRADALAATRPPAYHASASGRFDDPYELWQRDVGSNLPFFALAYRLTGEARYLQAAKDWSLASCGYPHWGVGKAEGSDLGAGHQLFGLALVYDWLYRDLDAGTLQTIRRALQERGAVMYRATSTQSWRDHILQNHLWVNITGLSAAAFAVFDEEGFEATAVPWLARALAKFHRTEQALGPDGANQEGISYWGYAVEYMLKYWNMAGDLLGEHPSSDWWRHTARYRLYLALPRNSWAREQTCVDMGDFSNPPGYGPDYSLRRLAVMNRDGRAQWLAGELDRAGFVTPTASWLNLLWYDPALPEQPPAGLPTLHHFTDMEIVSARTGWSGGDSLLVFRCGPAIGHSATRAFDTGVGSGHAHPDANHFVLFANGEWLLRDDGYMWKMTDQHNTLLVDGKGQVGEGGMWFDGNPQMKLKLQPSVLRAKSAPEFDEIVGDATQAYPATMGLRRYVRHLLFLKPDVLIVADDIQLSAAHKLELRLHPRNKAARNPDGAYLARGSKAVLRIQPLTPAGVAISDGDLPAKNREGKPVSLYGLRFEKETAIWRHAVALSWCGTGNEPIPIQVEQQGDQWLIRAGARCAVLNWKE